MEFGENSSSVHPGFRKARSSVVCSMAVAGSDLKAFEEQERLKQKASEFQGKLGQFGVGEYINEGYAPTPNWKLDFWGPEYVKLLVAKIRYDPDNLFSCYHCVGSDRGDFDGILTSKSPSFATCFSTILLMLTVSIFM